MSKWMNTFRRSRVGSRGRRSKAAPGKAENRPLGRPTVSLESLESRWMMSAVRPGFEDTAMPRNDDGSTDAVSLGFSSPINFFGPTYSSLFVNNNGNVTFGRSLSTYTPFGLTGSTSTPIIAPFFADVDTRNTSSGVTKYGPETVDGRAAFGVTWRDVGYFSNGADKLNTFQVVLIERFDTGPGNFDIELNYDKVQWETGSASGGSGGLGGSSARAGYSNGSGGAGTFFELSGSGVNGAFLDRNTTTGLVHRNSNVKVAGRQLFSAREGVIVPTNQPPIAEANGSYAVDEGGSAHLSSTGSADPDGTVARYEWDFNYDGTFAVDATGASPTFSAAGLNGPSTRTIALRVTDDEGATSVDTAALAIGNVTPTANPDNYAGDEDQSLNVPAPGVLSNDTDPSPDVLKALLSSSPTNGTLSLNNNGGFNYTPNSNFNGSDSFTYRANDGTADSNTVSVQLLINPVNDAPTIAANATAVTVEEGRTASVTGTFADVDSAVTLSSTEGTVNDNGDGTWTWSYVSTDNDAAHSVTITATDAEGANATVAFDLTVTNVAPTINGVSVSTVVNENGTTTIFGNVVDPGVADTHTVSIDWGDGTSSEVPLTGATVPLTDSESYNGHTYVALAQSGLSWTEAEKQARLMGGHLVTINDAAENQFVVDFIQRQFGDSRHAWIGLTDNEVHGGTEGDNTSGMPYPTAGETPEAGERGYGWVWSSSEPLLYQNWAGGEPNDYKPLITEDYAVINWIAVGNWNDLPDVYGSVETAVIEIPAQRTFSATHRYLDDDPTGTPSDAYTVSVTATDDDGGASVPATAEVTVNNVAPAVSPLELSSSAVNEDGSVTVTGTFSDPGTADTHTVSINWGDGTVTAAAVDAATGTFTATHRYLDDDPTGTLSDTYTVAASVTDDDGGSGSASALVTVHNVAPAVAAFASDAEDCGHAGEGEPVTVTGAFGDVGTLDTHTALVDWGDGSDPDGDGTIGEYVAVTESGGSGTMSGSHAYTAGGIYAITLTLGDDDGGAATATSRAVVTGAGIHNGVLQVVGTHGNDAIQVNKAREAYWVHAAFLGTSRLRDLPATGVTHVMLFGCGGDDQLAADSSIAVPIVMDGGAGKDVLSSGSTALMVGGTGRDSIAGGRGDDILVGGSTAFDLNPEALKGVFSGSSVLDGTTVFDDGEQDLLVGGAGTNTLFA